MKQGFFIKCSIILILIVQSPHLLAQELTKEGRGHFRAALALFDAATTPEDLLSVAHEFEQVLETDKDYPDTYLNLCLVYQKMGIGLNNISYFDDAITNLDKYHSLKPSDEDTYAEQSKCLQVAVAP